MVIEKRSVATVPAVWASGNAAMTMCANVLAKIKIETTKSMTRT